MPAIYPEGPLSSAEPARVEHIVDERNVSKQSLSIPEHSILRVNFDMDATIKLAILAPVDEPGRRYAMLSGLLPAPDLDTHA